MSLDAVSDRIRARIEHHGLTVSELQATQLAAYFGLLAKWNTRINLTALQLDSIEDAAVDRLLMEPVAAARAIGVRDQLLVDLGSGGGSPAIPLKIACPAIRVVMVESKARKAAFLRDVIRDLGLVHAQVENARFEDVARSADLAGKADVVSVRAVRADSALWSSVGALLRSGGRVLWFSSGDAGAVPDTLSLVSRQPLLQVPVPPELYILQKH